MRTRPGTLDDTIVDEVYRGEYRRLEVREGDRLLDLGVNIGASVRWFKEREPSLHVLGYEPDVENYMLALENTMGMGDVELRMRAVRDVGGMCELWVGNEANKAVHTTQTAKRGHHAVKVQCDTFGLVLADFKPHVIKCDIEGGEYDLDWSLLRFTDTRAVVMEVHRGRMEWRRDFLPRLHGQFAAAGFSTTDTFGAVTHSFNRTVLYRRG